MMLNVRHLIQSHQTIFIRSLKVCPWTATREEDEHGLTSKQHHGKLSEEILNQVAVEMKSRKFFVL